VHAHIILNKNRLKNIPPKEGDILHYSDRSFDQFFERFNRYSDYQANYIKKIHEQREPIQWQEFFTNFIYFKAVMKDVWFFIPGAPLLRFLWMYIVKIGFLDGRHGLIIALLYGFQDYVSKTKYYKLMGKKIGMRNKIQDGFIFIIAKIFREKELIINYKECLNY